MHFNIEINILD